MGIIIGAGTTVSIAGGGHATQVSWNINPNIQRAYILGSWAPYSAAEVRSPTETLNITMYSSGPSYATTPTISCTDANKLAVSVSPAGCGGGDAGPGSSDWFVTSYSYSKGDARNPGQESWAMMQYVTMGDTSVVLPTYVLRGMSEGSITSSDPVAEAEILAGIQFDTTPGNVSTGTTGSVSSGQIGRSDNQYSGVVSSVGVSTGASGDIVQQSSCSMPYTPLYL